MTTSRAPAARTFLEALLWSAALAVAGAALWAMDYRGRDADSRLYAEIGAQLAERPVREWIAPVFPPGWYMGGLFREHPAGIHFLPALLGRLGYPPLQAAYLANALYQVLSIVLVCRLAGTLLGGLESRAIGLAVQLIPIAFTFRVRANHEQALLLCLLVALYGAERGRKRPELAGWMAAGLVGLLLVKGPFVLFGLAACALWILARGRSDGGSPGTALLGLTLAAAAVGGAAWAYEALYRGATGQPFWSFSLGRQLGVAAASRSDLLVLEKVYNFVWYAARILWFAFPWSLVLVTWLVRPSARGRPVSPEVPSSPSARAAGVGAPRDGLVFVLLLTGLFLGAFSLSDRRADRYLFPVYYAVAAAGTGIAARVWPRLRSTLGRLDAREPWPLVTLWTVAFVSHFVGGWLNLPIIKVWAPDR